MIIQVYSDSGLQNVLGVIKAGEAKSIEGRSGIRYFIARFPSGDTTVKGDWFMFQVNGYGMSVVYDSNDKEPSTLDLKDFVPITNSKTYKYIYLSKSLRIGFAYYYYLGSTTIDTPIIQYKHNGAWTTMGDIITDRFTNVIFIGMQLIICPVNKLWGSFSGTGYSNTHGDCLCVSIVYRNPQQTGNSVSQCVVAFSPYELFYNDDELNPAYKKKNVSHRGGRGTGTTPAGNIPSMPIQHINTLLSSVLQGNGEGLSYYKLTTDALSKITSKMYPKIALFEKSAAARREAFVSLVAIPYPISTIPNVNNVVHLADSEISVSSGSADWIADIIVELNFGVFDLSGFMEDTFADVAYTNMTLYLPGVGGINIDPSVCAQGSIKVDAALDCRQGNILYRVLTKSDWDERGYSIYGHFSGNVGINIPLAGGTGFTDIVKNVAGLGMGLSATVIGMANGFGAAMMGNSAGGAISSAMPGAFAFDRAVINTVENAITVPHYDLSNNVDNMVTSFMTPGVRLIISRNRMINPPNYLDLVGIPTTGSDNNDGTCIGDFNDHYIKVQSIRLDGLDLTIGEQQELLALLAKGVFLN